MRQRLGGTPFFRGPAPPQLNRSERWGHDAKLRQTGSPSLPHTTQKSGHLTKRPVSLKIILRINCEINLIWTERLTDRELLSAISSVDALGADPATTASVLRLFYEGASLSLNRLLPNKSIEFVQNICCLIVDMGFSCQITPVA